MTILYIGNFEKNSIGEPEIAKCLEEIGHKVIRFDKEMFQGVDVEENYDIVLYTKFTSNFIALKKFLENCKKPKICWLFDLYVGI